MRPQHITAENAGAPERRSASKTCFNEAAAYHCGKHVLSVPPLPGGSRFNEAAAYHCGKLAAAEINRGPFPVLQ